MRKFLIISVVVLSVNLFIVSGSYAETYRSYRDGITQSYVTTSERIMPKSRPLDYKITRNNSSYAAKTTRHTRDNKRVSIYPDYRYGDYDGHYTTGLKYYSPDVSVRYYWNSRHGSNWGNSAF